MSGILVLAETRRGELRDVSLELVSAASEVNGPAGGRLAVAVIGADAERFASDLAAEGVDEVLTVSAPTGHSSGCWTYRNNNRAPTSR